MPRAHGIASVRHAKGKSLRESDRDFREEPQRLEAK
jgi:hypothetical protein